MSIAEVPIRFRPMVTKDLIHAHELSRAVGWPHRLQDWQWIHHVSQGIVAEDAHGILGTALCCLQGDYVSLGLVIVDVRRQGQGLGRKLVDQVLNHTSPRTPLLVATPQGAPLYASQGFITYEHIHQHQTASAPALPHHELPVGHTLHEITSQHFPQLIELASSATGMNRGLVLAALLKISQYVIGIERDRQQAGFALLRPFGRGLAIGPVVAESAEQAKVLIVALLSRVAGQFVRLDVTHSSGLSNWLTDIGIPQTDKVAQMVKGSPPIPLGNALQMALANQALC
ncbi:GNAT family N-acetyltransferase [Pseudomonas luteola]|uniref:GNAT family N-acetyltransferase n=2 Tax=Pseudomonas luteola TaxID=47886 RepID=UPI001239C105|nr:GNAT family N-acetyltransferase [Pseudomonas luteola]MBA1245950.1 GNAT family N-acetyltransferase [Pseudomonas zeshuii]QEU27379.1 GNAT family N-acetyltransferase [Pseudomonas luteola]